MQPKELLQHQPCGTVVVYYDYPQTPECQPGFIGWDYATPYYKGKLPPRYPVPVASLYYSDGPKHVAVAFQTMTHLVHPSCGYDYWIGSVPCHV